MDQCTLRQIAAQLRKPEGEMAAHVGEKMNEGNRHLNLRVIEKLAIRPGDQLLEIGMGNGAFVPALLSVDPTVGYTGCDYSPEMVREAQVRNQKWVAGGQARFVEAAADALPFPEGSFDQVFTVNTIYFWASPRLVLEQVYRVLKPGRRLLIALRPKATMQLYPFVAYDFRLYDAGEVTSLLAAAGFWETGTDEEQEPDQEINGQTVRVDGLIVVARKPG
jgi:ubiquinone/menaquinone biosynthesis C-methylase UbiE